MTKTNLKDLYKNIVNDRVSDQGGEKTLLIDGTNMFIRVFTAVPSLNDNGEHVGGLLGFLRSLRFLISQFQPTRAIIIFDEKGGSARRKKLFPGYKAGRATKIKTFNRFDEFKNLEDEQQSMVKQFRRIIEYLNILPIYVLSISGVEADDTIAWIIKNKCVNHKSVIVSSDKDFFQLITEHVTVYNPVQKKLYDADGIKERFGIIPENMITYRTLDGDASDDIPGVKGVGLSTLIKTFPELVNTEFTVDDLLLKSKIEVDNKSKKKIFKTILDSEDRINLNFRLMQLDDVDISGEAKLKIHDSLEGGVTRLNRLKFRKMLVEDRLHLQIKDPDQWLNTAFTKIEIHATNRLNQ